MYVYICCCEFKLKNIFDFLLLSFVVALTTLMAISKIFKSSNKTKL